MIEIHDVYKIFGQDPKLAFELMAEGSSKDEIHKKTGLVVGLKEIHVSIDRGELFVLMGLSGSGKSTLLRCINRLIEPTKGSIFIEAEERVEITQLEIKDLRRVRKNYMSMVFQEFALFSWRNILENVTYGLEIQGIKKREREEKALSVLEMVGLKDWAKAKPSELSGGMRQRVGLARALATDAPILLMDEPFSALDPLIKMKMQDELLNLQRELKKTIIFVTHDLDEALKIGDRIAIMEDGRIVQLGRPEEIILNPKTEYVANFIQSADVSNVLTAGSIARKLDMKRMAAYEISHGRDGLAVTIHDQTYPIRRYESSKDLNTEEEVVFAVRRETPIKQLMESRLYSKQPALILSDNNQILGIIEEEDILRGLLK